MKIELKAAMILLGTLFLGVALGAVGTGALARQRNERVQDLRRPNGFVAHMEDVIRPKDSVQHAAIVPRLEATARTNDSIIRWANEQLRATLDSMRAALAPLLEPEQRQRLDAVGRLPDPFGPPGRGGRGGPPPQEGRGPPPQDGHDGPPRGPPPRGGPPPGGGGER